MYNQEYRKGAYSNVNNSGCSYSNLNSGYKDRILFHVSCSNCTNCNSSCPNVNTAAKTGFK
jgi:heterodisulfide reductase subunit C